MHHLDHKVHILVSIGLFFREAVRRAAARELALKG